MTSEIDLLELAKLFDTAMTSDVPAVQIAFKNLMVVAAISSSDEKEGPLSKLLSTVKELEKRVSTLERSSMQYGIMNDKYVIAGNSYSKAMY